MHRRRTLILAILGLVLLALALGLQSVSALSGVPDNTAVASSVVSLSSIKDNTMYEESNLLSNGSGDYFFAGSIIEDGDRRRALVKFDIAGSIPSSAIILSATLRLHVSKHPDSPLAPSPVPFSLHRVLADWGEGTSDALEPGGSGATATEGDATWLYSHYSLTPTQRITWTTPGGDFVPDASASTLVGLQDNYYEWGVSADLTADVGIGSTSQMITTVGCWWVTSPKIKQPDASTPGRTMIYPNDQFYSSTTWR